MPGNPLVRFDEGRVGRTQVSPSLLLYRSSAAKDLGFQLRGDRDEGGVAAPGGYPDAKGSAFGGDGLDGWLGESRNRKRKYARPPSHDGSQYSTASDAAAY